MDVRFQRVVAIGSGFDRYIPILENKSDNLRYQNLIEESQQVSFDLTTIDDDEFWQYFLSNYNLIRYTEGGDGNWLKLYRLKPSITLELPQELAIIWGTEPHSVRFDGKAEETLLISHPVSGRDKEYIVLQGKFEFNLGHLFSPNWEAYELTV